MSFFSLLIFYVQWPTYCWTGHQGRKGLKGDVGFPGHGPKGLQGFPGPSGVIGLPGPGGIAGPVGDPGSAGFPGEKGKSLAVFFLKIMQISFLFQTRLGFWIIHSGERGSPGRAGARSLPGRTGSPGPRGKQGERGFNGRPGQPGDLGLPGVKGQSRFMIFLKLIFLKYWFRNTAFIVTHTDLHLVTAFLCVQVCRVLQDYQE